MPQHNSQQPWMIRQAKRLGFIETDDQARMLLIGVAIACVILAVFIYYTSVNEPIDEKYYYDAESYDPRNDPEEPAP